MANVGSPVASRCARSNAAPSSNVVFHQKQYPFLPSVAHRRSSVACYHLFLGLANSMYVHHAFNCSARKVRKMCSMDGVLGGNGEDG
eukprot:1160970-Pelagomonas_calceolata.AAC.7